MRLWSRLGLALVVLLATTGCAGGISGTPAVGTGGLAAQTTTAQSTRTSTESPDASDPDASVSVAIDALADDLADAERIVNMYWETHWGEFFSGSYDPPTVLGLYDGSDPAQAPTCDGEPLEAYNAVYCPAEDFVAWDANLLVDGADLIGDSWVYLVIAHEWGHAVQARLDPSLVPLALELQADCLGAAAIFGAVADQTLTLEEGDEREMISSLNALADEMAWTMVSDHGDPFQRVEWFTLGRNGGVQACIDTAATPEGDPAPSTS